MVNVRKIKCLHLQVTKLKRFKKGEFVGETKFRCFSYCAKILGFEN